MTPKDLRAKDLPRINRSSCDRFCRSSRHPRFRGRNPIPIPRLPATGAKSRGRVMAPLAVSGRVCDPAAVKLALKVPISKPKNAKRGLDYIPESGDPAVDLVPAFAGDDDSGALSPPIAAPISPGSL